MFKRSTHGPRSDTVSCHAAYWGLMTETPQYNYMRQEACSTCLNLDFMLLPLICNTLKQTLNPPLLDLQIGVLSADTITTSSSHSVRHGIVRPAAAVDERDTARESRRMDSTFLGTAADWLPALLATVIWPQTTRSRDNALARRASPASTILLIFSSDHTA